MMQPFSLNDINIVVTGASSGIGRAVAIMLAEAGARLILIARRGEELQRTLTSLRDTNHIALVHDLAVNDQLEDKLAPCIEKMGKVYGFVHCAGLEMTKPLAMLKEEHYRNVFQVNVFAGFELARILSKKKYLHEDGGSFVFIASIVSEVGQQGKIAYSSSKGAVVSGVRSMALELSSKKVRVNAISPAVIETDMSLTWIKNLSDDQKKTMVAMHPLGLGAPDDVANAVLFLLARESRWITGINLRVDGGYSIQ
jgi:NAD(P)-dependent dehydrogenase (short-subunit alcohol dehydrogenase family)